MEALPVLPSFWTVEWILSDSQNEGTIHSRLRFTDIDLGDKLPPWWMLEKASNIQRIAEG